MRFGLSHLGLPVRDLKRARAFYEELLGFPVLGEGEGWVDLEAGGVGLRLLAAGGEIPPATLRLHTQRVGEAVLRLVTAGATLIRPAERGGELEKVAELADPDGHRLVLWRRLREEEWGFVAELPTTLEWSAAAESLMQSLLQRVPETFRDVARHNAVSEAEHLAAAAPRVEVEQVVRGYIRATPRMMRERVRQPLIDHGLEPGDYRQDFEC